MVADVEGFRIHFTATGRVAQSSLKALQYLGLDYCPGIGTGGHIMPGLWMVPGVSYCRDCWRHKTRLAVQRHRGKKS